MQFCIFWGTGGVLSAANPASSQYYAAWLLETAAYCAVNCFALISGYVGVKSKFRVSNIVLLWLRVAFYCILITAIFKAVMPEYIGLSRIAQAFFPVMTKQYWYFSSYVGLFFLIPFVTPTFERLSSRASGLLLLILFALYCCFQTVFGVLFPDVFSTGGGYTTIWLLLLYLAGSYIGRFGLLVNWRKWMLFLGYLACVLISWGAMFVVPWLSNIVLGEEHGETILINYISPTIVLCSVFLLLLFERMNIPKRLQKDISIISPCAFSVYLIHEQPLFRDFIISSSFVKFAELPFYLLIPAVLLAAFALYAICTVFDFGREWLFKKLKLKQKLTNIELSVREKLKV